MTQLAIGYGVIALVIFLVVILIFIFSDSEYKMVSFSLAVVAGILWGPFLFLEIKDLIKKRRAPI